VGGTNARVLFDSLVNRVTLAHPAGEDGVKQGAFGEMMHVSLVNKLNLAVATLRLFQGVLNFVKMATR
jgi:hypothetical protein